MEPIACFMIEPSGMVACYLRRYTREPVPCAVHGSYHHAEYRIADEPEIAGDRPGSIRGSGEHDPDDPRWPATCACGYRFSSYDPKQLSMDRLYLRVVPIDPSVAQTPFTLTEAPAGALWDANWFGDTWAGPDGRCLCIKLPFGHEWLIDGPSSNGGGWSRKGDPPNITVDPSIQVRSERGDFHGWVRDGYIVEA